MGNKYSRHFRISLTLESDPGAVIQVIRPLQKIVYTEQDPERRLELARLNLRAYGGLKVYKVISIEDTEH